MKTIPPVLVSYLSPDMIHADFAYALLRLTQDCAEAGLSIGIDNTRCTAIEIGRGVAARTALHTKCSHILFLDSDMVFPPDTLRALLARNKDIVGCVYSQRRSPRGFTFESLSGNWDFPTDPREDPFEVKALGGGCILIRTDVFKNVVPPWFAVTYTGEVNPDGTEGHRSEDKSFCDRARAAGFKVWCDLALSKRIKHIGMYPFGLEHAEVATNRTF